MDNNNGMPNLLGYVFNIYIQTHTHKQREQERGLMCMPFFIRDMFSAKFVNEIGNEGLTKENRKWL